MPAISTKRSRSSRVPAEVGGSEQRSLWSFHGMEDVYFQRGSTVNFWTVMGGLQTAALLTQTGIIWEQIQAGRWYLSLYLLDSLLIIALIWALSSWESLILKWTISIPTILTQFLGNFALAITCLLITNPAGWSLGLTIAAACNWLHQILLSRLGAWEIFSPKMLKLRKASLWAFGLWPLFALAGAIHMYLVTSVLVQTIWGMLGLAIIIEALFRQHRVIERERKELGIP